MPEKILPIPFYQTWKGHPIPSLSIFLKHTLELRGTTPIVWLAGDSSLDNKFWVPSNGPAGEPLPVEVPDIYTHVLMKPNPKPDIAFWLNHFLGEKATVINTAVEASLLRERDKNLLEQDDFIKDNIRAQDVLVVSVGANDIALSPTARTAIYMLRLAWLSRQTSLSNGSAWSLPHFRHLFGAKVQSYITRLVSVTKPSAVIVCGIYFPLQSGLSTQHSWADAQLTALGYNRSPERLQAAIRTIFREATGRIVVQGTRVRPVALFEVMDGRGVGDYVERVEPSVEGGRKMGRLLSESILLLIGVQGGTASVGSARLDESLPLDEGEVRKANSRVLRSMNRTAQVEL